MKVFWTPEALQDRIDIWDFIAADNPLAAANLDAIFSNAAYESVWILALIHTSRLWPLVR